MIRTVNKLKTILILLVILILCAGFQYRKSEEPVSAEILTKEEARNKNMGGVVARMPDNSAKLLFEGLVGVKFANYRSYNTVTEILTALCADEIQIAWFSDVTADYILRTNTTFRELGAPSPSSPRTEFGLAVENSMDGEILRDLINNALNEMKQDGTLEGLIQTYILKADGNQSFLEEEMAEVDAKGTLYIGVSGAIPPLDYLNTANKPSGFSVALMNEIGQKIGRNIRFVVLNNETMFSSLMSGRVDALICYGGGPVTTEDVKPYLMTEGYYTMQKYKFLVQKLEKEA